MKAYPQLAMRVFNTPLLLMPDRAETVASVLAERLGVAPMVEIDAKPKALSADEVFSDGGELPYTVSNGVAVIQVIGELVNRGSWLDAMSGLTSYDGLASSLRAALDDHAVSGIVLDIDSPGGEAAGAMETGALVRQVSATKPVTAFVNGAAASAAYAIAAGAGKIVVTPSATLGSIGVVWLHMDRSAQMAKAGLKPTLVQKGKFKTDGSSLAPLPDDARGRIETMLDVVYGLFTSSVAAHRPALTVDAVQATEAGLFIGQAAIDAGLADELGTLETAVRSVAPARRPMPMTLGQEKVDMTDITKADHDAALAAASTAATANGTKVGAAAERTRVSAILAHAEAKGRESLAQHLAFETDMAPEAAAAVLKASPKAEAAPAGGSRLDGRVPAPKVEADAPEGAEGTDMDDMQKGAAAARAALGIR